MESLIGSKLEQRPANRNSLSGWLDDCGEEAVKQAEHILSVACHFSILLGQKGFQGLKQASTYQLHDDLLRVPASKSKDSQEI